MPWQKEVALVGGELLEDGTPAYRNVVVTVPRQSGKTTLVLSWETQRAVGWEHEGPQRIAYSAQTGKDSRDKLVKDQFPILMPHKKLLGIVQLNRGIGNEGVRWRNGSELVVLASNEESGHGKTLDLAIKDEFFADTDDRRDQAIIPATATKPKAQIITLSTAGTERSVPLNELVMKGRAAVEAGKRDGIAFFEWSADPLDDVESPLVWARCMPALGHTIGEAVVRDAFDSMRLSEFMRAFLNIPTVAEDERVWSPETWAAVVNTDAAPSDRIVVAVDANPERSAASVAVAGGGVVALVTDELGRRLPAAFGDLAGEAVRLAKKFGCVVAIDPAGPASHIIPDLEAAGVEVFKVAGQALGAACGSLYTDVVERKVTVRRHADLERAVSGAKKSPHGDVWRWARRDISTDVSPLVAVTLAWWAAAQAVPSDEYDGSFVDLDDFV